MAPREETPQKTPHTLVITSARSVHPDKSAYTHTDRGDVTLNLLFCQLCPVSSRRRPSTLFLTVTVNSPYFYSSPLGFLILNLSRCARLNYWVCHFFLDCFEFICDCSTIWGRPIYSHGTATPLTPCSPRITPQDFGTVVLQLSWGGEELQWQAGRPALFPVLTHVTAAHKVHEHLWLKHPSVCRDPVMHTALHHTCMRKAVISETELW